MKLVNEKNEIAFNGKHNKTFAIVCKSQSELNAWCKAFTKLLADAEPWTQEEIFWSGCEVEENETEVYIESAREDIAERTAEFKEMYKAAKAQAKRQAEMEKVFAVGNAIKLERLPVYESNDTPAGKITTKVVTKTEWCRNGLAVWFKGSRQAYIANQDGTHVWRNYPKQVRYARVG